MLLTKYTHSCVRLERDGAVLVIDPGTWSESYALKGADAVLVTHEHTDHIDVLRLAGLGVPVYAPAAAEIGGLEVNRVVRGETFTAAGFWVTAVGGRHASVFEDEPACANLGYVVEQDVYHPGDALHVPDLPVTTLLVPMQASWLKCSEAIGFVRAMAPRRAIGIHDGQINARGRSSINGWLGGAGGHGYRYLDPGQSLDLNA